MSVNAEIHNENINDYNIKGLLEENECSNVKNDVFEIVNDILNDILTGVINISTISENNNSDCNSDISDVEEIFQKIDSDSNRPNSNCLIDITKSYKKEFGSLIQKLKRNNSKSQSSSNNPALVDQVSRVIEESQNLDHSISLPEIKETQKKNEQSFEFGHLVDHKIAVTNLHNVEPEKKQDVLSKDYEEVIQVIDLEIDDSEYAEETSINFILPTDSEISEMEEINLNDRSLPAENHNEYLLDKGDQQQIAMQLTNMFSEQIIQPNAGETGVKQPVPNPTPNYDTIEVDTSKLKKKKKNLGTRLWNFLKRSKQSGVSTLSKTNSK